MEKRISGVEALVFDEVSGDSERWCGVVWCGVDDGWAGSTRTEMGKGGF